MVENLTLIIDCCTKNPWSIGNILDILVVYFLDQESPRQSCRLKPQWHDRQCHKRSPEMLHINDTCTDCLCQCNTKVKTQTTKTYTQNG